MEPWGAIRNVQILNMTLKALLRTEQLYMKLVQTSQVARTTSTVLHAIIHF